MRALRADAGPIRLIVRRTVIVWIAWLVAIIGALALLAASAGTTLLGSGFSLGFVGLALAVVTDASVGAVLSLRRPGNVVGVVLLLAAILIPITFLGFVGGAGTDGPAKRDVLAGLSALIGGLGISPTLIIAGPLLALVFPDGRLPGRRWRWPTGAVTAMVAVGSLIMALRPGPVGPSLAHNPLGVAGFSGSEPLWPMGEGLALAAVPAAMLLALAAVIVRARRARGVEAAQLKWFVGANVVVGTLLILSSVDGAPNPTVFDMLSPWSLSLPPLAVGVAVMRYRLFEIDRLIARTVSWAIVSGLLVGGFAAAVVALQAVLDDFIQGQTIAVAASTLGAFALFQPVRRRVQSAVDRRFDRARYDAERTVAEFSNRLREEVDIATVTTDLHATIRVAVKPTSVQLWIREARS
jgi:hypothetical protein